jgi:hypothetical protein
MGNPGSESPDRDIWNRPVTVKYNPWVPGEVPTDWEVYFRTTDTGVAVDLRRKVDGNWVPASFADIGKCRGLNRLYRLYGFPVPTLEVKNTPEAQAVIAALGDVKRAQAEADANLIRFNESLRFDKVAEAKKELRDRLAAMLEGADEQKVDKLLELLEILK